MRFPSGIPAGIVERVKEAGGDPESIYLEFKGFELGEEPNSVTAKFHVHYAVKTIDITFTLPKKEGGAHDIRSCTCLTCSSKRGDPDAGRTHSIDGSENWDD
jgi:hypothetical protein